MTFERVTDRAGRTGSLLGNGCIRVIIEDDEGMVPELSYRSGGGYMNAHWIPHFRGSTELYDESRHGSDWGSRMMFDLCGNFPCIPNFGPESQKTGRSIPANGYTANDRWNYVKGGCGDGYAYVLSVMEGSEDFSFVKKDIVLKDHFVHYTVIDVHYSGKVPQPANIAWHNTVGPPFLQAGCYLDACARGFETSPVNALPGQMERIGPSETFEYMDSVPLKDGSVSSLRRVPGMIGYSDFISGAVPPTAEYGWSSVFNPSLEALYMPFFQGPAGASGNEIPLLFNNFWLQYGGRPFWPWSKYDKGADACFAVGTESSISALAHGLDLSLELEKVGGNPAYTVLQPGSESKVYYATVLSPIEHSVDWKGISRIEGECDDSLLVYEYDGEKTGRINLDHKFSRIKQIEQEIA